MKHIILSIALLLNVALTFAVEPVRVACVGNSITYGSNMPNREKNSYPAQLQAYLGSGYEVKNFGIGGKTLLDEADYPYVKCEAYKQSLDYRPDIVLIKLGTNDSKPWNWKYKDRFPEEFQTLIDSYRQLPSHPRMILIVPLNCFLPDDKSINGRIIGEEVRPMVEQLAWQNRIEIINMYNMFGDVWQEYLIPDRIHPSPIAGGMMAKKVYDYLSLPQQKDTLSDRKALKITDGKPFNFHGYRGYEFDNDGVACKIVMPNVAAEGKPWVMRARFWGHQPQADIDLLEHGFYIAYCDVADLYGSPKAVKRWDSFYQRMTKGGWNRKVVLEGMSRGGLIVYNWAKEHPQQVACIYADAPVMDYRTWPMGQGGARSDSDAQQLLAAYGFGSEQEALDWKGNTIRSRAEVMAKHRIPILHVVGDADQVVPVAVNTTPFEKEMSDLGWPIRVIHKAGVDHHPHSLNNPEPIVNFILRSTDRLANECVHAVPGNEYRSAAGWVAGNEWHSISDDIDATLQGKHLKLLLLGNSITQGWGGNRKAVAYKAGKEAMDNAIGKDTWECAAISGDRTQNLLWRISNCNYNRCHPQNVVIAIGINNLLAGGNTAEETAEGLIAVTKEACRQFPDSRIILFGIYPSGKEKNSEVRRQCDHIHELLSQHPFERAEYVNPTGWFLDENGTIRDGLYGNDYIHFTSKGYEIVADKIAAMIPH